MKNIGKKIIAVMSEIKSIKKDGMNSFHKYKYATDAAIVSEIRKSMIKHNLFVIPNQKSISVNGDITTVVVEYTLYDADSGESISSQVHGYGQDKGDKGIYKAATGAEKYYLLKTFLLPTDDDPENDSKETRAGNPGRNTGVRVPAGYWKLKENDPQGAQDLIGENCYPGKTEKGYYVFTNSSEVEDKEFTDKLGPSESTLITPKQLSELLAIVKEKKIALPTARKHLQERFGYEGSSNIKALDFKKICEYFSAFEVGE